MVAASFLDFAFSAFVNWPVFWPLQVYGLNISPMLSLLLLPRYRWLKLGGDLLPLALARTLLSKNFVQGRA